MGKNGDPQTGWIGGGSLRPTGCSFKVDKFQQLSRLICIVSDVGVPHSGLSRVCISGVRANAFQLEAFRTQGECPDKQGVRISGGPHLGVPL